MIKAGTNRIIDVGEYASLLDGCASCKSSILLQRIVGVMFMRVNSKCAHQVRPPPGQIKGC
jgi:hypothetical protein